MPLQTPTFPHLPDKSIIRIDLGHLPLCIERVSQRIDRPACPCIAAAMLCLGVGQKLPSRARLGLGSLSDPTTTLSSARSGLDDGKSCPSGDLKTSLSNSWGSENSRIGFCQVVKPVLPRRCHSSAASAIVSTQDDTDVCLYPVV